MGIAVILCTGDHTQQNTKKSGKIIDKALGKIKVFEILIHFYSPH